jgi:putative transposase
VARRRFPDPSALRLLDGLHERHPLGWPGIRVLTVLDIFTREGLALRADSRSTGDHAVAVLTERGAPSSIRVDNGPEFAGRSLDLWAYFNGVSRTSAARAKIEAWRRESDTERPHGALGKPAPREFARDPARKEGPKSASKSA